MSSQGFERSRRIKRPLHADSKVLPRTNKRKPSMAPFFGPRCRKTRHLIYFSVLPLSPVHTQFHEEAVQLTSRSGSHHEFYESLVGPRERAIDVKKT